MSTNVCTFCGRLGANPEITTLPSGKERTRFSIAVDRDFKREDGTVQAIPMHTTAYQATKAMTALGCALNMSGVKEVVLWVCTRMGRVRHNALKFGTVKKPTEAA